MARDLSSIGHFEDGILGRLTPLFAGLLVLLVWLMLWLDTASMRGALVASMTLYPDLPEFGLAGSVFVAALVVSGLAYVFFRHYRLTAELRLREIELADCKDRLRRHVADLERVGDVAAHDLQEPLRRLVAYAQLLEVHDRGREDEEARLYLSHVMDGARRMTALISGLRSFVSVDNVARAEAFCAATTAVGVARKRLSDVLSAADVALVVDPLPEVIADQSSLIEIFVQLMDNAARFRSGQRRPVIHISAVLQGGVARFSIRDNGIGIEPSRVARMFEVFYRPHGSAVSSSAGIGMGLAVVRRLVERLGGEVWVESDVGKGSCFGFSLPTDTTDLNAGRIAKAA